MNYCYSPRRPGGAEVEVFLSLGEKKGKVGEEDGLKEEIVGKRLNVII